MGNIYLSTLNRGPFNRSTSDFVVKFYHRGYEISATPRDGVNVYKGDGPPLMSYDTGNALDDVASCKLFIDSVDDAENLPRIDLADTLIDNAVHAAMRAMGLIPQLCPDTAGMLNDAITSICSEMLQPEDDG